MNWSLFSVIFTIASTVVIGVFMVTALISGFNQIAHIQLTIALGFIFCLPVSWYFTNKIGNITGDEEGYNNV